MLRKEASLSILTIVIILVASIAVTLTQFGTFGNAQGQGNLTAEQKDAICNPNNPLSKLNPVNTTESRICGIPKTLNSTSTSSNMTTGEETSPTNLAPSVAPPPGE
jgi:hypothetical protein